MVQQKKAFANRWQIPVTLQSFNVISDVSLDHGHRNKEGTGHFVRGFKPRGEERSGDACAPIRQ